MKEVIRKYNTLGKNFEVIDGFTFYRDNNILNFKYKHIRLQILLPWVFITKENITLDLDTLSKFGWKLGTYKRYFCFAIIVLGLGICLEYHELSDKQIESQERYLESLKKNIE